MCCVVAFCQSAYYAAKRRRQEPTVRASPSWLSEFLSAGSYCAFQQETLVQQGLTESDMTSRLGRGSSLVSILALRSSICTGVIVTKYNSVYKVKPSLYSCNDVRILSDYL